MYYNVNTKIVSSTLPTYVTIGDKTTLNPPLKLCAELGWREMPKPPIAPEGTQIIDVAYVQDIADPLKVVAVAVTKTDADIAQEKADADKAAADAQAAYEAEIQKGRDEIKAAFPDEKQQNIILALYDRRFPW